MLIFGRWVFFAILGLGLIFLSRMNAPAEGTGSKTDQGTVVILANPSTEQPLRVGRETKIDLMIRYSNMPPGADLYVILVPLDGDSLVLGKGYKFSGTTNAIRACGEFSPSDQGEFRISPRNVPIGLTYGVPELLDVVKDYLPPVQLKELKEKTEGEEITFTFGFIASFGRGEDGVTAGSITFTPPDLKESYDGVLITPYIFTFGKDRKRCGVYDGKRMHSLTFQVISNKSRSKEENVRQGSRGQPFGKARIVSYEPKGTGLLLGAESEIRVHIEYADGEVGTEIYVLLNAVDGDEIVTLGGNTGLRGKNHQICQDLTLKDGTFRIPDKNKPVYATSPSLGPLEAAFISAIAKGGSGNVAGTLAFTPPPLATYYDGVRITPLLFKQRGDGANCASYNFDSMQYSVVIPIEGRR